MGFFSKSKLKAAKTVEKKVKRHTILIVDDEEANLRAISRVLDEEFDLIIAHDGQEALEFVTNDPDPEHIHLIISDQRMPKLTGVEFLRQTIPIIPKTIRMILTGFTDIEAIIDSINEGQIYKFITKPIEPNELLLTVQRALEAYELEMRNVELIRELQSLNANLEQKVRQRTQELEFKTQQMLDELEQAKETQASLLPETPPAIPKVKIAGKYTPMEQIGGDFYNIFPLDSENFGIVVADVTGHGVPAALISFMLSGIFSNNVHAGLSSKLVIELVNEHLYNRIQEGKFATMFYGIYNAEQQSFLFTNAGHPPGLVLRKSSNQILQLSASGLVVGLMPNEIAAYEEQLFQCQPGDKILIYTDGIIELMDDNQEAIGLKRLSQWLDAHRDLPIEALVEKVYELGQAYSAHTGFDDDITLVGLEVLE